MIRGQNKSSTTTGPIKSPSVTGKQECARKLIRTNRCTINNFQHDDLSKPQSITTATSHRAYTPQFVVQRSRTAPGANMRAGRACGIPNMHRQDCPRHLAERTTSPLMRRYEYLASTLESSWYMTDLLNRSFGKLLFVCRYYFMKSRNGENLCPFSPRGEGQNEGGRRVRLDAR